MTKDNLKMAAANFLSIPPIIHRTLRKKIIKTTTENIFDKIITSVHSEIILFLAEVGPLSIGEVGDQLMISKAQMTQLTDKLVDLNIIERRAVKGNRRRIEIALTEAGKKFLKEHKKQIDKWFMDALSDLTEKELMALTKAMANVKNILSKLK